MSQLVGKTGLTLAKLWHEVDAKGKDLEMLSSRLCVALLGKYKPTYTSALDCGDYVVVKNARFVSVEDPTMVYKWHTGWPKGKREVDFKDMVDKHPTMPIMKAVYNKLPKNEMRQKIMYRLKVFPDEDHPFKDNIFRDYTDGKDTPKVNLADI